MASCSQHVLGQKSLLQLKKYFYQCDQYYNTILLQLQYSSGSWLWKLLVTLTPFTYITFSVCVMRCYSCVYLYLIIYFLLTSVFMLESEKKKLTSPIFKWIPKNLRLPNQASFKTIFTSPIPNWRWDTIIAQPQVLIHTLLCHQFMNLGLTNSALLPHARCTLVQ